MNKFDERYEIRQAKVSDIEMIMEFIANYWKPNHIMGKNRKLFEYEFREDEDVNCIIAIDKNTGTMEAMYGFLYSSHTVGKMDIWGSIWKVNPNHDNIPFLGIELVKRFPELIKYRYFLNIGSNPKTTVPIMNKLFNKNTAQMRQFYILNPNIKDYKIAKITSNVNTMAEVAVEANCTLKEYRQIEALKKDFSFDAFDTVPFKDSWYVNRKYFQHPIRRYKVYGVYDEKKECVKAILVIRIISQMGRKVIRIIDFIGDYSVFSSLGTHFTNWFIEDSSIEYIDLYEHGLDERYIMAAGLVENDMITNVIPNYFEPFEQKNIDINICFTQSESVFLKGDGDQDRPNI